jgi:hypothetical protein
VGINLSQLLVYHAMTGSMMQHAVVVKDARVTRLAVRHDEREVAVLRLIHRNE